MTETYAFAISGLLQRRKELQEEAATIKQRVVSIQADVDAIDRVLDSLGYQGELPARSARAVRIVLFYRNELRTFILKELRASDRPLSTRELAQRVCGAEGTGTPDKRLLNEVVRRTGKALIKMRLAKVIAVARRERGTCLWQVAP